MSDDIKDGLGYCDICKRVVASYAVHMEVIHMQPSADPLATKPEDRMWPTDLEMEKASSKYWMEKAEALRQRVKELEGRANVTNAELEWMLDRVMARAGSLGYHDGVTYGKIRAKNPPPPFQADAIL